MKKEKKRKKEWGWQTRAKRLQILAGVKWVLRREENRGSQGKMTKGHLSPPGFARRSAENPFRRASVRANICVTRVTLRFLRPTLSSAVKSQEAGASCKYLRTQHRQIDGVSAFVRSTEKERERERERSSAPLSFPWQATDPSERGGGVRRGEEGKK